MYALQRLLLGISRGAWLVGSVLRHHVVLLMFVMRSARAALAQAVARALVPDDPAAARPAELPPATLQAVDALVPELAALLEARPGSQRPAACRRECLSARSSGTVSGGQVALCQHGGLHKHCVLGACHRAQAANGTSELRAGQGAHMQTLRGSCSSLGRLAAVMHVPSETVLTESAHLCGAGGSE